MVPAIGVVADDLATVLLVLLDFWEAHNSWAVGALDPERSDDLLDNSGGSSYFDVFGAHGAVLVHDEPVFNAELAEKVVAVVTFFSISTQLYGKHGVRKNEVEKDLLGWYLLKQIWQRRKSVKDLSISKMAILSVS